MKSLQVLAAVAAAMLLLTRPVKAADSFSINDPIVARIKIGTSVITAEQVSIPAPDGSGRRLLANVFKPTVSGPRPLIILNHGFTPDPTRRKDFDVPTFSSVTRYFLANNYVVALPRRRGYGPNDLVLNEASDCRAMDFSSDGLETARDIRAAIEFLSKQPYVKADHIIVAGHSGGGWGSLAIASLNLPGVRGVINLSGGRRCFNDGPDEKTFLVELTYQRLVEASAKYGESAKVPTLWIYAENDRIFPGRQARAMHDAFLKAGGRGEILIIPPFRQDGHDIVSDSEAIAQWFPKVHSFLKEVAPQ
jgi:pimeloyl-ACP methyl ester carboxylesterase